MQDNFDNFGQIIMRKIEIMNNLIKNAHHYSKNDNLRF